MAGKKRKRTRRGNGEGSVYQRKDKTWAAVLTVGTTPDGKPKRKFFYGKTSAEARAKMDEYKNNIKNGIVAPGKITFGDWVNMWLDNYVKPNIKYSTYLGYRNRVDAHIIPMLGHIQLKKITTSDIQVALNQMLENGNLYKAESETRGLAPRTVVHIRSTIKAALEQAVIERRIPYNPARQTKVPKGETKEMEILTRQEVTRFLDSTKEYRYYASYFLAFSTGMRRGEILGLPWRNITFNMTWEELDKRLPWNRIDRLLLWDTSALDELLKSEGIEITDAALKVTQQVKGNGAWRELDTPKTALSRRTIQLPYDTMLILIYQRHLQRKEAAAVKASGTEYNAEDLVFCNQNGGFVSPHIFLKLFRGALHCAGVKRIRFHDIRHTVATLLLEDGVQLNAVQELLGHYDASFTAQQYGHVTKRMQQETLEKITGILRETRKNQD